MKPGSNPLFSAGGHFSVSDSFSVAAPLPVPDEEDSFIGGPPTPIGQTPALQPPIPPSGMFQTPMSFFSTPAPQTVTPYHTPAQQRKTPFHTPASPQSVSLNCPTTPASPPPTLITAPPPSLSVIGPSAVSNPPTPLFPPPLIPGNQVANTPRRPVYAPAPFLNSAQTPSPIDPPSLPPTNQFPQVTPTSQLHQSGLANQFQPISPSNNAPPQFLPQYQMTAHWFYQEDEKLDIWKPFSVEDSTVIETALENDKLSSPVPVDGTRYDVHIDQRIRRPVYWTGSDQAIRRCSWFSRNSPDGRWVPYEEQLAARLEEEFQSAVRSSRWQTKVILDNGEWVMFHSPQVMLHFPTSSTSLGSLDDWGQVQPQTDPALRPRVVHRGLEGLPDIPDGETQEVDHLCFVVHGIGGACDIKFRPIAEVVDGFRELMGEISEKHFAGAHLASRANRVEFLPVNWHDRLHGEDTGTDSRIQPLTLRSIPKMRDFVNDTLLDVLFYTSPIYCQTILDTVCEQINNTYKLYCSRNPGFSSGVSVIGHSLGSLILFDLLSGQTEEDDTEKDNAMDEPLVKPQWDKNLGIEEVFNKLEIQEHLQTFTDQGIGMDELETCSEDDLKEAQLPLGPRKKLLKYLATRNDKAKSGFQEFRQSSVLNKVSYSVGPAGTGQPWVRYPKLDVKLTAFFALGSPIGMFMAVRGIECLGSDFNLPTCPMFFNIFHPYDPVAYRIESLVDPSLSSLRPLLIPHHMGRKRMHLELKETMTRVGTDIKQKVMESLKATMGAVYSVAGSITGQAEDQSTSTQEAKERLGSPVEEVTSLDVNINQKKRVDYVLQEAPMESFNEYVFALASHLCYWSSEDTCLMILREIYNTMNISTDDVMDSVPPPRSNTFSSNPPTFPPCSPSSHHAAPQSFPPPVATPSFPPPGTTPSFPPPPRTAPSFLPPGTTPSFSPLGNTPSFPPSETTPFYPQSVVTPSFPQSDTTAQVQVSAPPLFSLDSIPQRPSTVSKSTVRNPRPLLGATPVLGMDPTAPILSEKPLPPPPTMGFLK